MKFAQNKNPNFSFGINEYTRLFGTWEYVFRVPLQKMPFLIVIKEDTQAIFLA